MPGFYSGLEAVGGDRGKWGVWEAEKEGGS